MPVNKLFASVDVSAAALTANQRWMDIIAENLANAHTTRTDQGGPYRRQVTSFEEVKEQVMATKAPRPKRLEVVTTQKPHMKADFDRRENEQIGSVEAQIEQDDSNFRLVYDPGHPDANEDGYVAYPNVEMVREMVDMITASRAYEANVTALSTAKAMHKKAMEI